MTPEERNAALAVATRPYAEGYCPIPPEALKQRSWRYFLEINTACNLHCSLCVVGNREGYENAPGIMPQELLERILDKMVQENPQASVCIYGNSEPFLHPRIGETLAAIKRRGLTFEISSNLNIAPEDKMEAILANGPSFFIVSLSGFTQEIYERGHQGGKIDKVKANMELLSKVRARMGSKARIAVSYHRYKYNEAEVEPMKAFTESLGFEFMGVMARAIAMENTVQALRHLEALDGQAVPVYAPGKDGRDWNKIMPAANPKFVATLEQLFVHPKESVKNYERFPVSKVCMVGEVFSFIRSDGKIQLCACTDDVRLVLGDYLAMTQDQIFEARYEHPFCNECQRLRMNLYYMCVDLPNQ